MIEVNEYARGEAFDGLFLKLFCFGSAKVDSEWRGSIVSSAFSRLYYVKKNSFYLICNGHRTDFLAGRWYLVPAGTSYEFGCDGECEHLFLHFSLSGKFHADIFSTETEIMSIDGGKYEAEWLEKYAAATGELAELGKRTAATAVALSFAQHYGVSVGTNQYSPCVVRAIEYINANLSESLTVSSVANGIFVSKSTLTKHFRRELSTSVNKYIDDLILTRAAQMLAEGKMSLGTISESLGFCDQFYFSRKFKEKFGMPPSEYKRSWSV